MWVTANFKETQLADIRPGQPVDISIDAIPSTTFHGRVDSFQPGSGTEFSVLPAENATGNFVKIVQRLPVKIVFDDDRLTNYRVAPGLSVEPSVRVR
jgi:membrane fusion protein (multidrug efflux system)